MLAQIMLLSYYEFDLVNYLIESILEEFMGKRIHDSPGNGLVWSLYKTDMWGVRTEWKERWLHLKSIILPLW